MNENYSVGYCTTETKENANEIARYLLDQKLAACVNILPPMESSYWWEGKIESATEHLMIIKTRSSLKDAIIAAVNEKHTYSVPEIIFLPITAGSAEYLKWIHDVTE